jgi:GNAT superfamily N-acetyltransferase
MSLSVSPVLSAKDFREFVAFPNRVYRRDRNWVPPITSELRRRLDTDKNPFFDHAEAALFLARRYGEVVGRVSAQIDHRYNDFHRDEHGPQRAGFWGFFECYDDPDAARALLDSAAEWLRGRGVKEMVGPASFTLNDEAGLLVEGFHLPPVVSMTYNPEYYERLIEKTGAERAQDLFAYRLESSVDPPDDIVRFARTAENEFSFRTIDMHRFDEEVDRFQTVYNEAWEKNWGFVPFTEAEVRDHARNLKAIIDPSLVIVAELDDEPIGVGFTIPDVNQVLIRSRGRLGPVTLTRVMKRRLRRSWGVCRVFALGVRKQFRMTGVGARLYLGTLKAAKRGGYTWGEMSWILESNRAMNSAIHHMGGRRYKTYRMFRHVL